MGQLIGEIKLFAFDDVPEGWLPCNGQVLHIHEYPKLYTMLGTKFGQEGELEFMLPDLRSGETHPQFTYCIAVEGDMPKICTSGL